jgi:hypothetical protein
VTHRRIIFGIIKGFEGMIRLITVFFIATVIAPVAERSFAAAQAAEAATSDVPSALTEQWWRWRVALPEMAAPEKDPVGRFCDTGQSQGRWFLAGHLSTGTATQVVQRTCAVPAKTQLVFPVLAKVKFVRPTVTCDQAKAEAASDIDPLREMFVDLDGVRLPERAVQRVKSASCFTLDLSPGSKQPALSAASDGYWVSLDPLPSGRHVLVYGGRYTDPRLAESSQLARYLIEVP